MEQELNLNYFYNLAYLERKPVSAVIELLTECNLRCKHCYIPSHTNKGMSTKKIKSLLYELHAIGVLNISFTGGEIFLHPHIMDFIALARSLHMRVFLLSNGTLLNESIVKSLSELHISEFSTTMFSLDPKVHDFITSQPGSLDILLKNLQLLKKYNINVKIKTPLLDVNAFEYRDIKKYCEKNHFVFKTSLLIFSKTNGDNSPTLLRVKAEKLNTILKELDIPDKQGKNHLYLYEHPCAALLYTISIDANGNVFPCNSVPYKVGNVFEHSINEIWNESRELKFIQNIKKADLKDCIKCKYKEFCDRCPGVALSETGNILSCEPFAKQLAKIRASNYQI